MSNVPPTEENSNEKLISEIKQKLKGKSYREISDLLSNIIFEASEEAIL